MPEPWYARYFTADYWAYADEEYTAERTAAEVEYLAAVLGRYAPGGRVLDLGCGVGRHAIGLARRGFDVVGVDISEYALARADRAAAAAGVLLELHRADLLGALDWGVGRVDAAVCVQAFGWGTDGDQLRLLRTVRRLLPPGGVLVLDHSNALAILRRYRPEDRAEIGGATFHFVRRYDPLTGRSGGEVRIRRADGSFVALPDDVRLYHPAEVADLLRRAGFDVSTVDADFTAGAPVTVDTRYVQFSAVPAPVPVPALDAHAGAVAGLDLRWAPDEADLVAGPIAAAWAEVGFDGLAKPEREATAWTTAADDRRARSDGLLSRARRYDLADPYSGERIAPVLGAHLGFPLEAGRVFAGAGTTGLQHGLALLAGGGTVLTDPAGHPCVGGAAVAAGARVRTAALTDPVTGRADLAAALAAVAAHRPALTVLDRPGVLGRPWPAEDVTALANAVSDHGGLCIVDETCGAYLPPGQSGRGGGVRSGSVAALTDRVPGLVVLRSMSKGYCCGGLRVGFAIASPDAAARVREVVAPLAVSALALDVSLALLRQGDPLAALRERIAAVKPRAARLLADLGVALLDTDPRVPWLAAESWPGLAERGLTGREVPVLYPDGSRGTLLRLSVPLSAARLRALEAAAAVRTF